MKIGFVARGMSEKTTSTRRRRCKSREQDDNPLGRFTPRKPALVIVLRFQAEWQAEFWPRFDIAPTLYCAMQKWNLRLGVKDPKFAEQALRSPPERCCQPARLRPSTTIVPYSTRQGSSCSPAVQPSSDWPSNNTQSTPRRHRCCRPQTPKKPPGQLAARPAFWPWSVFTST
jgi:hypothetical protein